jgi:PPOX class probable F420-dependent enzyme
VAGWTEVSTDPAAGEQALLALLRHVPCDAHFCQITLDQAGQLDPASVKRAVQDRALIPISTSHPGELTVHWEEGLMKHSGIPLVREEPGEIRGGTEEEQAKHPAPIPASHRDLFAGNACVALTTLMPDGQPQITPVWCNLEGAYVLINSMRGFRKEKNLRANPKVTLLAYDPQQPLHHVEIRGTAVEMTEVGALEHLDHLTQLYLHRAGARFFGDGIAAELQATSVPVKITILPTRVRVEG